MVDISKWDHDDDPLTREQAEYVSALLDHRMSEAALEGFLIVSPRFVDEFGAHRTPELEEIFRTTTPHGKDVLRASLEYVRDWVGGMSAFEARYPVTISPARPAFPMFKIVGIERLAPHLYRVLDSRSAIRTTGELVEQFVVREGRLPPVPRQRRPVRRTKPRLHWCSYEAWASRDETRERLQILHSWSDCGLRARLPTVHMRNSAFVAFNGDREDPTNPKLRFYKYFYEPLAQDHGPLRGGGPQIGLDGGPRVDLLERWDDARGTWTVIWSRP